MQVNSNPVRAIPDYKQIKFFDPGSTYFAQLATKVAPNQLSEPMLERFPFQPSIPVYNPAIEHDYLIKKGEKGAFFFLSDSKRLETAFFRMAKHKSLIRDIKQRLVKREEQEEHNEREYWVQRLLADRLKSLARFESRADRVHAQTNIFFDLLAQSYHQRKRRVEYRIEESLESIAFAHRRYWQAVDKNLEKEPKPLVLSGTNLTQILSALPFEEEKSRVIRWATRIKENNESMHAGRLLEHMSPDAVPSSLYSAFLRMFHRPSFDEKMRQKIREENSQAFFEARSDVYFARQRRNSETQQAIVEKIADRIADFWQAVEKRRRKLLLPSPLTSVNEQVLLTQYRYKPVASVLYGLAKIQQNQIKAYKIQISEHADQMLPFVAPFLHVRHNKTARYEELYREEQQKLRSQDREEQQLIATDRLYAYRQIRTKAVQVNKEVKEAFLADFDHNHQKRQSDLILTNPNAQESLHQLKDDSPSRFMYALEQAKRQNGTRPNNPITSIVDESDSSFHLDPWLEKKKQIILELEPKKPAKLKMLAHENPSAQFHSQFQWQAEHNKIPRYHSNLITDAPKDPSKLTEAHINRLSVAEAAREKPSSAHSLSVRVQEHPKNEGKDSYDVRRNHYLEAYQQDLTTTRLNFQNVPEHQLASYEANSGIHNSSMLWFLNNLNQQVIKSKPMYVNKVEYVKDVEHIGTNFELLTAPLQKKLPKKG